VKVDVHDGVARHSVEATDVEGIGVQFSEQVCANLGDELPNCGLVFCGEIEKIGDVLLGNGQVWLSVAGEATDWRHAAEWGVCGIYGAI